MLEGSRSSRGGREADSQEGSLGLSAETDLAVCGYLTKGAGSNMKVLLRQV